VSGTRDGEVFFAALGVFFVLLGADFAAFFRGLEVRFAELFAIAMPRRYSGTFYPRIPLAS
jgi:hypothetical protein